MASRAAQVGKPSQVRLGDDSLFVCSCGSDEFRKTEEDAPLYMFCRCGQVYTAKDLEEE